MLKLQDFLKRTVVRTQHFLAMTWVQSLVRELQSCKLCECGQKKKKLKEKAAENIVFTSIGVAFDTGSAKY